MDNYWNIPTEEQDTTINFSRNEKGAEIWTTDRMQFTRFDKLCQTAPDYYKCLDVERVNGGIAAKKYYVSDRSLISFRTKKTKLNLTDEQRQKMVERLKHGRDKA